MSSSGASGDASLRVLCGPTAAGKSALAMQLAESVGAAIISADSRQIYRGFDIGTAKPTAADRRRVPHFGIDTIEPTARYSAAEWVAAIPGWIDDVHEVGRSPLLVGGTGFYLRALFAPLFEAPELPSGRREALRHWMRARSTAELRRWCTALDAARAHLGRAQLERAVETALLAGTRISELHQRRARAPTLTPRYLVVDPGAALPEAIAARVDAMLAAGWIDEVRALARVVPADAAAWTATGYEALRRVVNGSGDLTTVRDLVIRETRQYAKRQRTWFRHQLGGAEVAWLDPREADAFTRAMAWWTGKE